MNSFFVIIYELRFPN